jgi:nucleotide-binding universal stress UspA family protein
VREVRERLEALAPTSALERRVRTETHVVTGDDLPRTIARKAKELDADLIVAGTHGRTGFGRVLMGSVASDLLKATPDPVLLVYPGRRGSGGRGLAAPFRSVLCPTDLSDRGNEAVPIAHALAGEGGTVHVLHVWHRPYGAEPENGSPSREDARRALDAVARAARAPDAVRTTTHLVEGDDPAVAIARHAAALPADLVVLATHGRTGIHRVAMGTVASEAIRGGAPVVLVPRMCDDPR